MAEFEYTGGRLSIYSPRVVNAFKAVIANVEEGVLISKEEVGGRIIKTTEQTPIQPNSVVKGFKFRTTGRGLGRIFNLVESIVT